MSTNNQPPTLLCLSHLRWDHVWQRPQQLMTRFAERCRVIYVDPPDIAGDAERPHIREQPGAGGVRVLKNFWPDE